MRRWTVHLFTTCAMLACAATAACAGANGVFSPDGTDVWAVGDGGQVFRSLDGGQSFFNASLGDKALNGVAARGFTALVVGDSGKVWRSTNSGGSWTLEVPSGTGALRAVAMASDTVAYAAGDGGRILKSVNGGASWSMQTSGTSERLRALAFSSEEDGWAAGDAGTVLHTVDGGTSWDPVDAGTTEDLFDVDVSGASVWVVGRLGTARASTDGGASFSPVNLRLDAKSDVRAVCLVSPDSVVLGGGGGFVRVSDDGGATWTFPVHRLYGSVGGIAFAGGHGFVADGDTMTVIHSSDGGATWALPAGTAVGQEWVFKFDVGGTNSKRGNTFALNWQDPRTLYCMLQDRVYVSRDLGETWTQTGNPVSSSLLVNAFIVSPKDSNLWVAAVTNPDRIVRTTNGGQSWSTRLSKAFGEYGIPVEMDPDHPDTLFFGPDNDVLYRSTDFGQNWAPYSNTSFRSPCDVVVVPESDSAAIYVGDGVTGSGNGELWRATDGSLDFNLQNVASGSASEIPTISVSRLEPRRAFMTSWSAPTANVTTDEGLTWSPIPGLSSVTSTWGTDIARDDPNVVMINRYSGSVIYLSHDGGANWDGIVKSGANYAVFMRDRGQIFELQSTGIFKLKTKYTYTPDGTQSLALATPNGGEVWDAGSTQAIEWSAANVAQAVIEYRRSSADPWLPVATVPGYLGSYAWTVPYDPTTTAEVRVRDGWDGTPADVSAAPFTIAAPLIAASPDPLDFGAVPKGAEGVQVLTIDNAGTATLDVTSASVATPSFTPARTSFSVPAGGSDTLAVLFDPLSAAAYDDTLELASNAAGSPLRVALTGAGVDTLMLALTAPDGGEVWNYGTVHRIQWQSALVDSVKLEYRTGGGMTWQPIAASVPADSAGYWWVIPDAPTSLASVRVSQIGGSRADSSAAPFEIAVPRLQAMPLVADLGPVTVGQSLPFKIALDNVGTATLELTSIISDDADFVPGASSLSIAAQASDSLLVTFTPQTVGPDTAHVTILTNGPNSPVELLLTGAGTQNVAVDGGGPTAFALNQNQPNPFAGRTTIRYAVPVRTPVVLDVYDLQGHRVATLVDRVQEPGTYTVPFGPGMSAAGGRIGDVRAGVYFYRLRAGAFSATRKMLFLR